jgi:demethylmenaquinone methyltransferase/2-methoxy-6-polyprenyl-1,4-benzoquinol methylase/phosphoethanolamine N-methyltransferase
MAIQEPNLSERSEDAAMRVQMERMVSSYDTYMKVVTLWRERALREETLDLARLAPGESYLEVGCGTGTLAIAARQRVGPAGRAAGIDVIPGMIDRCRDKAARAGLVVSFQVGSMDAIPFPAGEFDAVVGSFVILHMSDRVRHSGIREIRRVLRPGGRLLFVDLAEPGQPMSRRVVRAMFGWAFQHDLTELAPLLAESGFDAVEFGRASFRILGMSVVGYVRGRVPSPR